MSDERTFVTFPVRIWNLPGITIQLLKFYEKIFQFWHHRAECFIGNKALMEYCGMKSESTVRDAFTYFESHGEMKRITIKGRRHIVPPQPKVIIEDEQPVDKFEENRTNIDTPSATALVPQRHSAAPPSATALHNINNSNTNKLNKSFCLSDGKKKTKNEQYQRATEKPYSVKRKSDTPRSDVSTQSNSFKPLPEPLNPAINRKAFEQCMASIGRRKKTDTHV